MSAGAVAAAVVAAGVVVDVVVAVVVVVALEREVYEWLMHCRFCCSASTEKKSSEPFRAFTQQKVQMMRSILSTIGQFESFLLSR